MKSLIDYDLNNIEVDEFTTVSPIVANREMTLKDIWELMKESKIRHMPILEKGKSIGIVSERDLLPFIGTQFSNKIKAHELMHEDFYVVQKGSLLKNVVFDMSQKKIGSALVEDKNGDIFGIFTSVDALNALNEILMSSMEPM